MASRLAQTIASGLKPCTRPLLVFNVPVRLTSSQSEAGKAKPEIKDSKSEPKTKDKKSMAELDEALKLKMQELAGDGGDAGLELEDGQPVSMKRSVRNNMFRYI